MKTQKFWLVSVLIEHSDFETIDKHTLYSDYHKALKAKEAEVEEGRLYIPEGHVIQDLPTVYQMVDDDGNSLTVVVEEIQPQ